MRRSHPAWWTPGVLAVTVASMGLRALVAARPGLGRDEAAYLYWAFQPEPAYAPLLQLLLRLGVELPVPLPWAARVPGWLVGTVTLPLLWTFLRARGESRPTLALAAVALSPWALYVGAVVHPDALFVLATIAFAAADRRRHLLGLTGAALLAAAAKPSGFLLVLVTIGAVVRAERQPHRLPAVALATAGLAGLAWLSPAMLEGLQSFARLDPGLGPATRLVAGAAATLALGGLVLPAAGVLGMRRGPWTPSRVAGAAYVVAFLVAAVGSGQVKGNWALPGLLLLWPPGGLRVPRPALGVGTALTALAGAALVTATLRPAWVAELERARPGLRELYVHHAGGREATVSSTRSWTHRLREYGDLEATLRELAAARGTTAAPAWIVCDDYGLAAQVALALATPPPRLVLPTDPVFARTVRRAQPMRPTDGILYIGVRRSPTHLAQELEHPWTLQTLPSFPHPVTGEPIALARASR